MSGAYFIAIITDTKGKILGAISADKYDGKVGELRKQWTAFIKWRKEAKTRTILTAKEKRLLNDNIAEAFGQFLYMQDDHWAYNGFTTAEKNILKLNE
jgi:hypothetical protein